MRNNLHNQTKSCIFAYDIRIGRESDIKTFYPLVSKRLLDPFAEHLGVLLFIMEEVWKDVVGYEGYYMVSNIGRVKSVDRTIIGRGGFPFRLKGKLIKVRKNSCGYCVCKLVRGNRQKIFTVHRLMMLAFVPNPHCYPAINHKDERKDNNFLFVNEDGSVDLEKSNLEWCTYSYNINYGTRHERYRETCKRNHSTEKFLKTMKERGRASAEKEVLCLDDNMNVVAEYKSVAEGARQMGVYPETIRTTMRINKNKGKKWKSYGFLWVYKEDYTYNK